MSIQFNKISYLLTFAAITVCISMPCQAEIYKCVENGKTTFSQYPCEPNARVYNSSNSSIQTIQKNNASTARQGQALYYFDPDLGIQKCTIYPDKDGAKEEHQMSMNMLNLLAPLVKDEKAKKEIESFRNMKLVDSCPSGAKIKCYPDLLYYSKGMSNEDVEKQLDEIKKTHKYEFWYPNGKDIKKLSDSCSTGIFEILP